MKIEALRVNISTGRNFNFDTKGQLDTFGYGDTLSSFHITLYGLCGVLEEDEEMPEGYDGDEGTLPLGTASGYVISAHEYSFEYLDEESQDLCDIAESLELIKEDLSGEIVILNRMQIIEKYRGNNYGSIMLKALAEYYSKGIGSILVLNPFPFELKEEELKTDKKFPKEKITAGVKKLQSYYKKFGFREIEDSGMYAFPLDYKFPTEFKHKTFIN